MTSCTFAQHSINLLGGLAVLLDMLVVGGSAWWVGGWEVGLVVRGVVGLWVGGWVDGGWLGGHVVSESFVLHTFRMDFRGHARQQASGRATECRRGKCWGIPRLVGVEVAALLYRRSIGRCQQKEAAYRERKRDAYKPSK